MTTTTRPFGRLGVDVTLAGFGSVALGNMGRVVSTGESRSVIDAAWDGGVRFFDTAPMYGHGLAEYRLAEQLRDRPRDEYFLVTKVGRTLTPASDPGDTSPWIDTPPMRLEFDYSYDGVMRQVDASLQRMGTDRFDALLVHDTDRFTHGDSQGERFREALDGAFPALMRLRDEGVTRAVGIGVNETDVCLAALEEVDLDCLLIAGTFTLLDQSAEEELLPECERRGVAVINGRVFGSGILATGTTADARFNYAAAPPSVVAAVRQVEDVCARHGVELGAVAARFASSHPAIANVCIGARTPEQQARNDRWMKAEIPDELWHELEEIRRA